jgi:hypothetical protein
MSAWDGILNVMPSFSEVFDVLFFFLFPERQVLLKKFNDRFSISEGLLINVINLLKSVGKSLVS